MRILITGVTGFVGGHLAERLLAEGGHTLVGISRRAAWPQELSAFANHVALAALDLQNGPAVETHLASHKPDCIYHLAGYANTGKSFEEPDLCWADNLTATRTLYDAIGRAKLAPRVVYISSGLIYGEPDEPGRDCDERTTLKPASPYAASKAAADLMSFQYSRTAGLNVVRVRLFNQVGPRQSADYSVANFARQIAAAEAGKQEPVLTTGDLSAQRDITDVRDMAAALCLLATRGDRGEAFNAGRGQTYPIQGLLDRLVAMARVKVEVRSSNDLGRKSDTAVTRADTTKLRTATGWVPAIPIDKTLEDTLDYWRGVARKSP